MQLSQNPPQTKKAGGVANGGSAAKTSAKRTAPAKKNLAKPSSLQEQTADTPNTKQTGIAKSVERIVQEKIAEENSPAAAQPQDRDEIRKQFKKRRASVPSYSQVKRYNSDPEQGLTDSQVNERFSQFLFNDTNQKYSKSYASIFAGNLCTFFNLLCALAAAALIYSGAGLSQFLFVLIFALNLSFGIAMEIKAKRKIDKLSLLNVPTAKVMRNGEVTEIPAKDIVLDDIVLLGLGNQIPADCIVAQGSVEVNESLLTGESVPVKKEAGDQLFAGSFVTAGNCRARADKVGKNTYLNSLSAKAKKYKKPKSELMRSTKLVIMIVGILIIPIAIGMFFINWNNFDPALSDLTQLNDTIQRTVSIVIGMIPSGMLLLTSIALTLGIIRLMTHNTLVQDLYSLEMLARVNVLCLDKTGTITDGRMKVNDCMLLNNPTEYSVNEIVGNCLYALQDNNQTSIALYNYFGHNTSLHATATLPFSSKRKLSAVTFEEIGTRRHRGARIRPRHHSREDQQDHQSICIHGTARARRRACARLYHDSEIARTHCDRLHCGQYPRGRGTDHPLVQRKRRRDPHHLGRQPAHRLGSRKARRRRERGEIYFSRRFKRF